MNIKAKLRRKWNYAYNDMRGVMGMNERLFKQARGARIIVYHGICRADHTRFNSIFLQIKTFEAHLQFYKKYFHVISLDDYYHQRFSVDRFNICITFDDGFANNYRYVLPLMNKYRVPVTFFVTGIRQAGYDVLWNDLLCLSQKYGSPVIQLLNEQFHKNNEGRYVSATGRLLRDLLREKDFNSKADLIKLVEPMIPVEGKKAEEDYWLQMTTDEIRNLSRSPYATIGSHGYYHNDLSAIAIDNVRDELVNSKHFLEQVTGKAINAIAFPYGAYSNEVIVEAKAAGYNQLLAADFLSAEDNNEPTMRARLTVNPYISVNNQMTVIINGKYE